MENFKLEVSMMELELEVSNITTYESKLFTILAKALRSIKDIDFDIFDIAYTNKRRLKVKGKYTLPNYIKMLCRVNKEAVIEFLEYNPRFKETFFSLILDDDYIKNRRRRYTFDEARSKIAKSIKYIHPYWVRTNMSKYLAHDTYSDLDILVLTDIIDRAYRMRNRLRLMNYPTSVYDLKDLIKLIKSKKFINEHVGFIDTAHRKVEGTPYYVRFSKTIIEYWEFYEVVNTALRKLDSFESAV